MAYPDEYSVEKGSITSENKQPFISKHRQELDRIKVDATESRSHPVPDYEEPALEFDDFRIQRYLQSQYVKNKTVNDWVGTFLPAWRWLSTYKWKETCLADLIAGLSVGFMVIPQGMSYSKLAGLPVQYGLYSAQLLLWMVSPS